MANNTDEEAADFSNYLKSKQKYPTSPSGKNSSPIQESQSFAKFTRRAKYLIVLFVILLIAQIVLLIWIRKEDKPALPAGYHLVTPPNQPSHIEKDK